MTKPLDMEVFLTGMLTGAHATRERHIRQAKTVQAAIFNRWRLDNPWTWQRKHVVWFLTHEIKDAAPATRYYYQLTANLICSSYGEIMVREANCLISSNPYKHHQSPATNGICSSNNISS